VLVIWVHGVGTGLASSKLDEIMMVSFSAYIYLRYQENWRDGSEEA
jgi:hypothetical protein